VPPDWVLGFRANAGILTYSWIRLRQGESMSSDNEPKENDPYSGIKPLVRLLCYLVGFGVANYVFFWHVRALFPDHFADAFPLIMGGFLTQLAGAGLAEILRRGTTGSV
jgi:hypothetical protein